MNLQASSDLSERMAAFENSCRKASLKVTHQRLEIYRELAQAYDHPSAEVLYRRIIKRLPTISLDTVYRTLATLNRHGLISRVQTGESQARYEVERFSHHHAVCRECGAMTDFIWTSFDETQVPATMRGWGEIIKKNVVLEGTCCTCSGKDSGTIFHMPLS